MEEAIPHWRTPAYHSWRCMRSRCSNPKDASYHRYGARGISVCEEWQNDFRAFLRDMGERPAGTTLHRLDNSLGYFRGNCVWGTPVEQAQNREVNHEALSQAGRKGCESRWSGHVPPWRAAGVKKATYFARPPGSGMGRQESGLAHTTTTTGGSLRLSEEPETVWDIVMGCERRAPSDDEIDDVQTEVLQKLSALGGMQAIAVCLDIIAALLHGEDFKVGSRTFGRYLTNAVKFITQRVRQLERNEALMPADIKQGRMQ